MAAEGGNMAKWLVYWGVKDDEWPQIHNPLSRQRQKKAEQSKKIYPKINGSFIK